MLQIDLHTNMQNTSTLATDENSANLLLSVPLKERRRMLPHAVRTMEYI